MRIGIVTPRYPPTYAGGGEISAQLLATHLATRDRVDAVEVLSFDGGETETVEGITVRRLADPPQYPYTLPNEIASRKLRALDLEYDLLHAYNMHLHPAVGRLSSETGIPSVATLNAYPLLNWGALGITRSVQRRLYEQTVLRFERPRLFGHMSHIDEFLPLSTPVERIYRGHGFDDCDFTVIPNMIDPSFEVPSRTTDESTQRRLLYVGYLRDSKGVRYLVDAMSNLSPAFHLTVVGDGPKREALEARANERGVADRVTFTGQIPYEEVTRAYAAADVFVHPGVWPEPFGRTILEAMQAGLPVVATNVGGPAETVPQEELRCSPGDPAALRRAIKHAYDHRARIGEENRTTVRERYHPDQVVPKFLRTYERQL